MPEVLPALFMPGLLVQALARTLVLRPVVFSRCQLLPNNRFLLHMLFVCLNMFIPYFCILQFPTTAVPKAFRNSPMV